MLHKTNLSWTLFNIRNKINAMSGMKNKKQQMLLEQIDYLN